MDPISREMLLASQIVAEGNLTKEGAAPPQPKSAPSGSASASPPLPRREMKREETAPPPPPEEEVVEDVSPKRSSATQQEEEEEETSGQAKYPMGAWRPCEVKPADLRNLQAEGSLEGGSWRVEEPEALTNPQDGERIMIKTHVEHGFSLPPSEFFS
jgi:hypothetical protein